MRRLVLALLTPLLATPAWANDDNWSPDPPQAEVQRAPRPHWLAVGAGLVWNQTAYYGLGAEYGVDPKLTFVAHAGINLSTQAVMNPYGTIKDDSVRSLALGLAANYYVIGNFEQGMRLGAQMVTLNHHAATTNFTAEGAGYGLGAHIGARWIWPVGLTVECEGGVLLAMLSEFTYNANVPGEMTDVLAVQPFTRAAVGWAF